MQPRPNIVQLTLLLILGFFGLVCAQNTEDGFVPTDTIARPEPLLDTLQVRDAKDPSILTVAQDSLMPQSAVADTLVSAPEFLEDLVDYYGEDYVYMDQENSKVFMYNKAFMTYLDYRIDAGEIILDYAKNEVYANLSYSPSEEVTWRSKCRRNKKPPQVGQEPGRPMVSLGLARLTLSIWRRKLRLSSSTHQEHRE